MSHRINVLIDDQLWEDLRHIPRGERSRLINESLAERLKQKKRERLLEEMQAATSSAKPAEEDADAAASAALPSPSRSGRFLMPVIADASTLLKWVLPPENEAYVERHWLWPRH